MSVDILGTSCDQCRSTVQKSLRKPEGSLGQTAQDGHLDSHTAPELLPFECWFRKFSSQATKKVPGVLSVQWVCFQSGIVPWGEIGGLVNGSVKGFLYSCVILLISCKCFTRAEADRITCVS